MFVLAVLRDVVPVPASKFGQDLNMAVADEINRRFANKVVHKLGLCIALHDLLSVGDAFLLPGDGKAHVKVEFRFVIFRPRIGEVLIGTVRQSDETGVRLGLTFFEDIMIPAHAMQAGSYFDVNEQLWVWPVEGQLAYIEKADQVRFRVTQEIFVDITPLAAPPKGPNSEQPEVKKQSPYSIEGTIKAVGLGVLNWW
eukprot:m.70169 g.70169  ORF g.70169 m.70169 type:complete len:197 (-) comp7863_c0_seq2:966-1556(-)